MVVAVALALHNELAVIPWQELDGVQGFHILVAGFAIEFSLTLACGSVVGNEAAVVLVAVEFKQVDGGAVGAPGDVGEVDGEVVSG